MLIQCLMIQRWKHVTITTTMTFQKLHFPPSLGKELRCVPELFMEIGLPIERSIHYVRRIIISGCVTVLWNNNDINEKPKKKKNIKDKSNKKYKREKPKKRKIIKNTKNKIFQLFF